MTTFYTWFIILFALTSNYRRQNFTHHVKIVQLKLNKGAVKDLFLENAKAKNV